MGSNNGSSEFLTPYTLPDGWVWTTLGEIAEIRNGVTKGRDLSRFDTIEVPYLRVANVQSGYLDLHEVKTIRIKTGELEKYQLQPNDILFTEGGDRDKLGRGTVWWGEIDICVHQNHIHCARLQSTQVDPRWASLASQLPYARHYFQSVASQTVNLASLNASNLKNLPIPLPPLSEQRRLLQWLLGIKYQIRIARRALASFPPKIREFCQSILAAAFRGELTERDPNNEPAHVLLERIRAERQQKWDEGLRAQGKDPAKYAYEDPAKPDSSQLPKLPEGWVWTTLGEIGEVTGGLTKNANRRNLSLKSPYISVANVYADQLILDEVGEIGVAENEILRTSLQKGDLLVVEGNGSSDQIGRVAIWDGSISDCLHQNHIIKVRLSSFLEPRLVLHWLLSPPGREVITRVASSTSGLYTLSISKVASLPIPVPPLREQQKIVLKIDALFVQIGNIKRSVDYSSSSLVIFEQAVLYRVFRGLLPEG